MEGIHRLLNSILLRMAAVRVLSIERATNRMHRTWRFENELNHLLAVCRAEPALAALDEGELRALKVGYRAPFLIETARRVRDGFPLEALPALPYDEARAALMTLPGVGGKVADCALLFGCRHTEAFPVDVWVERLLRDWFGLTGASRDALAREGRALLGEHAGLMQQFLFHAARVGAMEMNP